MVIEGAGAQKHRTEVHSTVVHGALKEILVEEEKRNLERNSVSS